MAENDVPPNDGKISLKALKAKWTEIFEHFLKDIFEAARTSGIQLTPDEAMAELDDALGSASASDTSVSRSHPALRRDVVAVRRKVHRFAVDQFYDTFFPEGKPKRGAPQLPLEHLDRVLRLTDEGLSLQEIAKKMGYLEAPYGGRAADRIRKQVAAAQKIRREALKTLSRIRSAQWPKLEISELPTEQPAGHRKTSS